MDGNNPNSPNNGNDPNNGQNNPFKQRAVMPVQPQPQAVRAAQPVPVQQGTAPGQAGMPIPHRTQLNGLPPGGNPPHSFAPGTNVNPQAMKAGVKPPPPAHPADDKPKDKATDKDKKEQ